MFFYAELSVGLGGRRDNGSKTTPVDSKVCGNEFVAAKDSGRKTPFQKNDVPMVGAGFCAHGGIAIGGVTNTFAGEQYAYSILLMLVMMGIGSAEQHTAPVEHPLLILFLRYDIGCRCVCHHSSFAR